MEYAALRLVSTDPHHHTNKNDAFACLKMIKSLLAATDVAITSDHDFTTNNFESYNYALKYNIGFAFRGDFLQLGPAQCCSQTKEGFSSSWMKSENNVMDQLQILKYLFGKPMMPVPL